MTAAAFDVNRFTRDKAVAPSSGADDEQRKYGNARRHREVSKEFGSLAAYVWRFAPPPRKRLIDRDQLMAVKFSPEALALSKDLRKRGFRFVGPTTVYAAMQSCGVVNDHLVSCFVRGAVQKEIDAVVG